MNDSQQDKNNPPMLQSLVLIFLETIFTFILKHDRIAQIHAKPFIKLRITISVNTFLPSKVFFMTFDPKGLLFDLQKPEEIEKPQLTIYASGLDLIKIFFTGNKESIEKIGLSGEEHLHGEFRLLMESLSLPSLASDWKNWLSEEDEVSATLPQRTAKPLMERMEQQRIEIRQLTIQTKEYQYDLKALQRKYKIMTRLYWLIIILLSISFLTTLCYYLFN